MALLDTATDEVIRLRRLLLDVASLGIVTDEDRVGPAAAGHHWLEMPRGAVGPDRNGGGAMTTIEFSALVGEHIFTGADFGVMPTPDRGDWERDISNCFRFVLDGVTYVAVEDDHDDYRSSMRALYVDPETNVPPVPAVRVVLTHRTTGEYDSADVLVATVIENGRELFSVGTENTDDYYPWFVSTYDITALPGNAEVARG